MKQFKTMIMATVLAVSPLAAANAMAAQSVNDLTTTLESDLSGSCTSLSQIQTDITNSGLAAKDALSALNAAIAALNKGAGLSSACQTVAFEEQGQLTELALNEENIGAPGGGPGGPAIGGPAGNVGGGGGINP